MRSEKGSRKEGFEEGTPVLLADGQEWQFPRPRVRLTPANNDRGFATMLTRPDGGAFARLMAEREALVEKDEFTVGDLAKIELAAAKQLLTANYDLDDAAVAELIQFSYKDEEDPEGSALRDAVLGVMLGCGAPKRSADGDGSPSSSTASTPTGGPSTT